jgi:hypothetical protein
MKLKFKTLGLVAAVMALGITAKADLVLDYSVGGDTVDLTPSSDTATFALYQNNSGTLDLVSGVAQTINLNTVTFKIGNSGLLSQTITDTASRSLTVSGFGTQSISQHLSDTVTFFEDILTLEAGAPVTFTSSLGTLTFTPDAEPSVNGTYSGETISETSKANVLFTANPNPTVVTPVPEASTIIAGGLILLPFGLSVLRGLRKSVRS